MSHVRGKGNKATEIVLVQLFLKNHISGWRRRIKVFGNLDFVFWKHRLARKTGSFSVSDRLVRARREQGSGYRWLSGLALTTAAQECDDVTS